MTAAGVIMFVHAALLCLLRGLSLHLPILCSSNSGPADPALQVLFAGGGHTAPGMLL